MTCRRLPQVSHRAAPGPDLAARLIGGRAASCCRAMPLDAQMVTAKASYMNPRVLQRLKSQGEVPCTSAEARLRTTIQ